MRGLTVTDVRREWIQLLWTWSTDGETSLAKGFCSNMGDTEYPCVCRRTKLPGRGVHNYVTEKNTTDTVTVILLVLQYYHCSISYCCANALLLFSGKFTFFSVWLWVVWLCMSVASSYMSAFWVCLQRMQPHNLKRNWDQREATAFI